MNKIHGPWDNEPDKLDWVDQETGLPCKILRVPHLGHLCGYVGVDVKHPFYGLGYSDTPPHGFDGAIQDAKLDVRKSEELNFLELLVSGLQKGEMTISLLCSVHGGLTFAAHWPDEDQERAVWWFGFDCAHCDDLTPYTYKNIPKDSPFFEIVENMQSTAVYRDINYVKAYCAKLAQQLNAFKNYDKKKGK